MRVLSYIVLVMAVGVWPATAFDGPTQSTGGKKTAPASTSKAKPGAAKPAAKAEPKTVPPGQKFYDAGIKAYEAGNLAEAIKHLGAAIRAGSLDKQQIAKALYYRGVAFRRKGKPGQAISDLTRAAWLKDGLTAAQRSEALSNRNAAYREAGISEVPPAPESVIVATGTIGKTEPAATEVVPKSGARGWETATLGTSAVPASKATMPSPGAAPAAASTSNSSTDANSSSSSGSGSSGGGFFSSIANFFTGGGGTTSEPASNQSKEPPSAEPIAPKPETSSWHQTTQVASAPPPAKPKTKKVAQVTTPFTTQVAAATPPIKPNTASTPSGKYRLQVAAVRSRSEADRVAASVMQKYADRLGQRRPVVDEAVIGSMGTFYRVRVGPYANVKEPQKLCGMLRSSGFDCLVVTQ